MQPSRPSSPLTFAAWGTLESCQKKLEALHASIHATELEFFEKASPEKVFASGNPNPTAVEALTPVIARVMKGDRQWMQGLPPVEAQKFSQILKRESFAPPDYTLECRTWACKMRVLNAQGQNADQWELPLQLDPEIKERTRVQMVKSGLLVTDPISAITFAESHVFLILAEPSGNRVPSFLAIAPMPQTHALCQSELELGIKRLAMMKSEIERNFVAFSERFKGAGPNPNLTVEFNQLVRANLELPIGSSEVTVECRGFICRVEFANKLLPDDMVSQKTKMSSIVKGKLSKRIASSGWESSGQYYQIVPDGTAYGGDIVKDVYHNLLASTSLAACETKHSPKGTLDLDFEIPPTGEMNQDGELGKISAHLTGRFMDTAFGRCVEASLAQILERTPVPSEVSQGKLYGHAIFPRSKKHKP
jgi:hypothetical protein